MASRDFWDRVDRILLSLDSRIVRFSHDPAFMLFTFYPGPEQLQSIRGPQDSEKLVSARAAAVRSFQAYSQDCKSLSLDPDYDYLVVKIADGLKVYQGAQDDRVRFDQELQSALTRLALNTDDQRDSTAVNKKKDRILDFYRWVARGRKDDGFQFITQELTIPGPSPPANGSVELCSSISSYNKLELLARRRQIADLCSCEPISGPRPPRKFCPFCTISPTSDIQLRIKFYCDKRCASIFSRQHEQECRELRLLTFMTSIFTNIFLLFEDRAWPVDIASISEVDELITVRHKSLNRRAYLGLSMLQHYPETGASSEQMRLLRYELASADWIYVAHGMVHYLLSPVAKNIRKMTFQPKNAYKATQRIFPDGKHMFSMLQSHEILCITLPSGQEFAFDPTGGRYGWKETLSPLADYVTQRVHFTYSELDLKGLDRQSTQVLNPQVLIEDDSLDPVIRGARKLWHMKTTSHLFKTWESWLRENNFNGGGIVDIPDELFAELQIHTHDMVTQFLNTELPKTFQDGKLRLCLDESAEIRFTNCLQTVNFLKRVWLTEAEYSLWEDDEELLKKIWIRRYEGALRKQKDEMEKEKEKEQEHQSSSNAYKQALNALRALTQ